jgi:hypothetical protein
MVGFTKEARTAQEGLGRFALASTACFSLNPTNHSLEEKSRKLPP